MERLGIFVPDEEYRLKVGNGLAGYMQEKSELKAEIKSGRSEWTEVWEKYRAEIAGDLEKKIRDENDPQKKLNLIRQKNLSGPHALDRVMRRKREIAVETAEKFAVPEWSKNPMMLEYLIIEAERETKEVREEILKPQESGPEPWGEIRTLDRKQEVLGPELVAREKPDKKRMAEIWSWVKSVSFGLLAAGAAYLGKVWYQDAQEKRAVADFDKPPEVFPTPTPLPRLPTAEALGKETQVQVENTVRNTPVPTDTVKKEMNNDFAWLDQGGLKLAQPFKVEIPLDTAKVLAANKGESFVPTKIEVNGYNTVDQAWKMKWGAGFGVSEASKYDVAVEQGPNGRAIVYCHSGTDYPCNWIELAAWYPGIVGKEVVLYQGGYKYTFRIGQVKTVTNEEFDGATRQFEVETSTPLMVDTGALGVYQTILNSKGVDFVACGGTIKDEKGNLQGVPLLSYKTIVATTLEKSEAASGGQGGEAVFYDQEYNAEERSNMILAAQKVNNTPVLAPGETFSFNTAMNYYQDQGWIGGQDFIRGGGACNIATLEFRALAAYSSMLGEPLVKAMTVNGSEVWMNSLFMVEKSSHPHSDVDTRMPADEIVVKAVGSKAEPGDIDFTVTVLDTLPSDIRFKLKVSEDAEGNFRGELESNYSPDKLQQLVAEEAN